MGAVFKREFRGLFHNIRGFLFLGIFAFFIGLYIFIYNISDSYSGTEVVVSAMAIVSVLVIPLISIGLFSTDRAKGTDMLLRSLPLSPKSIAIGKYLALVAAVTIPVALMVCYFVILGLFGDINYVSAYSALLLFYLFELMFSAIFAYISSLRLSTVKVGVLSYAVAIGVFLICFLGMVLPDAPLVSFVVFLVLTVGAGVALFFYTKKLIPTAVVTVAVIGALVVLYIVNASLFEGAIDGFARAFSPFFRVDYSVYGIFDFTSVIFYIVFTVLFLWLTVRSVERKYVV